jgi:hypothetical protein
MTDGEVQTTSGNDVPMHRWYCHDCALAGPAVIDGATANAQLTAHLEEKHTQK